MARKRKYVQKIPVERVIYDNYDLWKTYPDEEIKEYFMEENGYEEDEITDEMIWKERYFLNETNWEEEKERLKKFFLNGNKWILFGTVGRWDGLYRAGTLFDTFDDFFYKATSDCNYWKFYDENGHLYLTCSHHDGTCCYEIKEVTDKGVQYFDNWEYNWDDKRSEEYVHTQIINKYSRLPRYMEKVFGCKRYEYKPTLKEVV